VKAKLDTEITERTEPVAAEPDADREWAEERELSRS